MHTASVLCRSLSRQQDFYVEAFTRTEVRLQFGSRRARIYARHGSSMCDYSFKPLASGCISRGAFLTVTWILLFICDLKANSNILYSSSIETRSGASVRSTEVNPVDFDSGYLEVSLLAVVTTAVSFYGVGDARLSYLETILNNFKDVCEIGLDVSVILTAYEGAAVAWLEYLSSRYGTCRRDESSLRYDLELFPSENCLLTPLGQLAIWQSVTGRYFREKEIISNFSWFRKTT